MNKKIQSDTFVPGARRNAGFSLIELMVGLTVGLIALAVVTSLLASFQIQNRTTLGVDDAQNSGTIALDQLQRDIQMAGYGFSQVSIMRCPVTLRVAPDVTLPELAPAVINPQDRNGAPFIPVGDANSDTLLVAYAASAASVRGLEFNDPAYGGGLVKLTNGLIYAMYARDTVADNDWVIADLRPVAAPMANCAPGDAGMPLVMQQVTKVAGGTVNSNTGVLYSFGRRAGGQSGLQVLGYAVRNGSLTVCDYTDAGRDCADTSAANWVPVANNVVALRAQYGRDGSAATDVVGVVNTWDRTAPDTGCRWAKVQAIRLALVVQSPQSTGETVTGQAHPGWLGSDIGVAVAANPAAFNLATARTGAGTTWQNYRYKVFETTVPLRNNQAWSMALKRDHPNPSFREPTGCAS